MDLSRLVIVHSESSPNAGGQEWRTLLEMEWMRERGAEVWLLAQSDSGIAREAERRGLPWQAVDFRKGKRLSNFLMIRDLFREKRPHVVASHSGKDHVPVQGAAQFCGVPFRIRYRHISLPIKPGLGARLSYRALCDHVVTTGKCIKEDICAGTGLPEERASVIPTGIQLGGELPDRESARRALAEELNLPESARFLGTMSFLRSDKGIRVLLEAFNRIAAEDPDLHLVIPGEGPEEKKLRKKRDSLLTADRIHFVGYRARPLECLAAYDVQVQPSLCNEGVPQAVLQAMACGVPVVGTDVGGIPDVVDATEGSRLVPPDCAESLGDAILGVLAERSSRGEDYLRMQGRMRDQFTLDAMGEQLVSLYRRYLPDSLFS